MSEFQNQQVDYDQDEAVEPQQVYERTRSAPVSPITPRQSQETRKRVCRSVPVTPHAQQDHPTSQQQVHVQRVPGCVLLWKATDRHNNLKGYGKIQELSTGKTYFAHHSEIRSFRPPPMVGWNVTLHTGEYVEFTPGINNRSGKNYGKPVALNITGIYGGPVMADWVVLPQYPKIQYRGNPVTRTNNNDENNNHQSSNQRRNPTHNRQQQTQRSRHQNQEQDQEHQD